MSSPFGPAAIAPRSIVALGEAEIGTAVVEYLRRHGYDVTERFAFTMTDAGVAAHVSVESTARERKPYRQLTQADVIEIYEASGVSCGELAKRYGVTASNISSIRSGKTHRAWTEGLTRGESGFRFYGTRGPGRARKEAAS